MIYKLAAVGGTFDFLHKGHKKFLLSAFDYAEKVLIGLTSDEYISKYKNFVSVASFKKRKEHLEAFLMQKGLLERTTIIPLHDQFGPAITGEYPIDAVVVTADTKKTGEKINEMRMQKGMQPLDIVSVDLVKSDSLTISSSFIRANLMDKDGHIKIKPVWLQQTFFLPNEKRVLFQQPFGKLVRNLTRKDFKKNPNAIVTVGDVTTKTFNDIKLFPKIAVVDFVVERKKIYQSLDQFGFLADRAEYKAKNPAGTITPESWNAILHIARFLSDAKQTVLTIAGEEDLLVLPLVIALPVGFTLYYGQPHEGIVELEVTIENKQRALELMNILQGTTRGY